MERVRELKKLGPPQPVKGERARSKRRVPVVAVVGETDNDKRGDKERRRNRHERRIERERRSSVWERGGQRRTRGRETGRGRGRGSRSSKTFFSLYFSFSSPHPSPMVCLSYPILSYPYRLAVRLHGPSHPQARGSKDACLRFGDCCMIRFYVTGGGTGGEGRGRGG